MHRDLVKEIQNWQGIWEVQEKRGSFKGEAKISGKFEDVTRWAMFEPHARQFIDHMERK